MKNAFRNPFSDLKSSDDFEFLCRDLLAKNYDVKRANKLFKQGSKQFGADIVVYLKGQAATLIAQCKWNIESEFTPKKIRDAVDEFLKYWDTVWKDLDVKEFVLYVARPINSMEQHKAILEKKKELLKLGVEFDYVDQGNLVKELEPHRDIVRKYLDQQSGGYWEQKICGIENRATDGFSSQSPAFQILNQNLEQKTNLLSEKILEEIKPVRHLARSGKTEEALTEFSRLKTKNYDHIDAKAKAEILSLEIRISLPHEIEIGEARNLLTTINKEDPTFDSTYLEALITSYESGIEAGLAKLDENFNTATLNLKLTFLVNLGKSADAFDLYQNKKDVISTDTETKRLYALILLSLDKLDEAETLIEEAWSENPEWAGVRLARAIIFYHTSLSPQILSENPLAFAEPQPWNLVKTDRDSLEKRNTAAELFASLLPLERRSDEEQRIMESWYLACLADNPLRQIEASEYCQNVLESQPTHTYLIIWALARNLSVDSNLLEERFEAKLNDKSLSNELTINKSLVLLALFLRNGRITKAKRHLTKIKSVLGNAGENNLAAYWACQVALAEGKSEIVEEKLSQKIDDVKLRQKVQVFALTTEYHKNPSRKTQRKLTNRLQKLYRRTQDPFALMYYCQICHSHKNWGEVIKFGSVLLQKTKTLDSLRLVCDAYYQNQQPEKCLDILKEYKFIFFDNRVPNDLNLLETYCLLKIGKIGKAAAEAKQLFESDKSARNLLAFIETHRHTGDVFSIEKAVKEMDGLDDIAPAQKLRISKLIAPVNPELAQEIWRQAKPDLNQAKELIDTAFFYGNQIGLEGETGDLMKQMMDATRRGENSHRLLSIKETFEMFSEQSKHFQEVDNLYSQAKTATHFLCEQRNLTLSTFYRYVPMLNQEKESFKAKLPVMIRHGSRTVVESSLSVIKPDWNFHLDFSSLLLIYHLGLLDKLEKFAPIYISTETIPFLNFELVKLSQTQPAREAATRQIVKNLENSKCQKINLTREITAEEKEKFKDFLNEVGEIDFRSMMQAVDENATIIDYLPIRNYLGERTNKIPEELSAIVQDWRSVLKGLIEGRCLNADSLKECQKIIENQSGDEAITITAIPIGSTIYLAGLTAIELAKAGVFDDVCRNFQVHLDARDEQLLRDEIRKFEQQKDLSDWLKNLQEKLREGFEGEVYQGISVEKLNEKPPPRNEILNDYRVEPLLEILRLKGGENDVALIDDRWASGYRSVNNQTPILTIYEILIVLKQNEVITEKEYYELLLKLKNENFRYLPSTGQEILYHLDNDAPPNTDVGIGRFQRSPELKTSRRYAADCLLDDERLQKPIPQPSGIPIYAEIEFVFASERAVVEAIGATWSAAESIQLAKDKADVLLFDFFVGRFGLRHFLPAHPEHENGIFHFAADFAELCFQGIVILTSENFTWEQKIERLEAYFAWLELVFTDKFRASETFTDRVVKTLATCFQPLLIDEDENDENAVEQKKATLRLIHLEFINHLPDFLRNRLLNDEQINKNLEFKPERVIYVGDMRFSESDLSDGIAKALNNEKASVALQNDKNKIFEIKNRTVNSNEPIAELSDGNSSFNLLGSLIGIHFPTVEQRLEFMRFHNRKLDCPAEDFYVISREVSESESPTERTETYNRWARKSAYVSYENLSNFIMDKKSFSWAGIREFPLEGLPKHFRFNLDYSDKNFGNQFQTAAKKLLQDEGVEEALNRFARFPILMPPEITSEFNKLPVDERKTLLERFKLNWRSPVNKLHYVFLALQSLPDDDEIFQSAKSEVSSLLKPGEENFEFEIFQTILRLVGEEFFLNSESKKWTLPIRLSLVWAHSSEIYNNVIKLADNSPNELEKLFDYFNSMFSYWRKDVFFIETDYRRDYLHPNYIERETFLGFAFGNLFADFSEDLIERLNISSQLKELCFFENSEQMLPKFYFLKDFSGRGNATLSFAAECFTKFNSLVVKEGVLVFNNEIIQDYLLSAFEETKPDESVVWKQLMGLSDDLPLNAKFGKFFAKLVEKFDFEDAWQKDEESALFILRFIAFQKELLSEKQTADVEKWLKLAVSNLAVKYPNKPNQLFVDKQTQEKFSMRIAEICVGLCIKPNSPIESSEKWNQMIFELGETWTNLHVWLEPHLFNLWRDLSVEQIQGIGRNLLMAKSLR